MAPLAVQTFGSIDRRSRVRQVAPRRRLAMLASVLLPLATAPADAAGIGAVAVGACDRLGYATGYDNLDAATAAALQACASNGDRSCKVILSIQGNCAAFAIAGPCGARGWATAPDRRQVEEKAVTACSLRGGRDCTVRRSICDGED